MNELKKELLACMPHGCLVLQYQRSYSIRFQKCLSRHKNVGFLEVSAVCLSQFSKRKQLITLFQHLFVSLPCWIFQPRGCSTHEIVGDRGLC